MEINTERIPPQVVRTYLDRSKRVERAGEGRNAEGTSARGMDELELSQRARDLQRVRAHLQELPEVRSDRVEQLREQIQSGAYHVPAEEVARKIVEFER